MSKLGVLVVGVGGAVASTVIAGVHLMRRGLAPRIGMITERGGGEGALPPSPVSAALDFASLDDLVFAGWDIQTKSVYESALHHGVLPAAQLAHVKDELSRITPWPAVFTKAYAKNLDGEHVVRASGHRAEIEAILRNIEAFKAANGVDRCVMVNLASTESWREANGVHTNLAKFEAALDADDPNISPSMRYFYAANKARVPFCNFTPTIASHALEQHAVELGNPFCGCDGKTGQTLVKTALASMFRARQLQILGWYSVNFLGNNDGLVLNSPDSNKTKVMSKTSVLDSILGYEVPNHQVHIHYYKPRGDAKEAWDNIDIIGFGGVPMQMKINFLCQDSILAAPLVIDLIRLLDVAKRSGERGIQRQLSMFFKSPYAAPGETPVHDLFEQERMLLDWVEARKSRA
jgi:myo-inositol-1-phosphate synthase